MTSGQFAFAETFKTVKIIEQVVHRITSVRHETVEIFKGVEIVETSETVSVYTPYMSYLWNPFWNLHVQGSKIPKQMIFSRDLNPQQINQTNDTPLGSNTQANDHPSGFIHQQSTQINDYPSGSKTSHTKFPNSIIKEYIILKKELPKNSKPPLFFTVIVHMYTTAMILFIVSNKVFF